MEGRTKRGREERNHERKKLEGGLIESKPDVRKEGMNAEGRK